MIDPTKVTADGVDMSKIKDVVRVESGGGAGEEESDGLGWGGAPEDCEWLILATQVLEEHEQNVRSLQHGSQKDRYGGGKD